MRKVYERCCGIDVHKNILESAGKRKSGRTTKGNSTLKRALVQCAVAAVKKKSTFFYAQYQRIAVRRGKRRALLAVAHSILIAIYNMLKNNEASKELGADYYNQFNQQRKINMHLKKLKDLGWKTAPQILITVAAAKQA